MLPARGVYGTMGFSVPRRPTALATRTTGTTRATRTTATRAVWAPPTRTIQSAGTAWSPATGSSGATGPTEAAHPLAHFLHAALLLLGEDAIQLFAGFLLQLFQFFLLLAAQLQLLNQRGRQQLAWLGHHKATAKTAGASRATRAPTTKAAGTSGTTWAPGTTRTEATTALTASLAAATPLTAALSAAFATPAATATLQGFHLGKHLLHLLLGHLAVLVGVQALEQSEHPLVVFHLILGDLAILVGIQLLQALDHLGRIGRGATWATSTSSPLGGLGHRQTRHQADSGGHPKSLHSRTHRTPPLLPRLSGGQEQPAKPFASRHASGSPSACHPPETPCGPSPENRRYPSPGPCPPHPG